VVVHVPVRAVLVLLLRPQEKRQDLEFQQIEAASDRFLTVLA
jgi:hypothetical protein